MKKLLVYLKDYKKESILGPLFKLLEASFELIVPLVVASMIDVGIAQGDKGYVGRMCLIMAALGLIGLVCSITAQYFAAKAAVGFATKLRHGVFEHIQKLSFSQLDREGTATLITRITSDINQVQSGVNLVLRLFLRSPLIVFGAMILAFTIDVKCALIFAVAIPLLLAVVFAVTLVTIPMFRRVQSKLGDVLKSTRGSLVGARVIRAFCAEDRMTREFDDENDLLTSMQKKAARISVLLNPLTYLIINAAVIVLIWTGAARMEAGLLTQGALLALYDYMSQILIELIKFANFIVTVTKSVASAERIDEFMAAGSPRAVLDAARDADKPYIAFDHVSFHYPRGGDVLHDISFTANRGETVGIIGGTGSGKTTLVNLIPRYYDATGGTVAVDGLDVRAYPDDGLQRIVGYVPQKAVLFRGSIRDNMRWGKADATDAEIVEAITRAQGEDILRAKGSLDAAVVEGGKNFSGGQRQRLTIARALVRKPEILILDDSASALDYATDARLRATIRAAENPPTTFIVSQRAASVMHADKIIVLDDGHVVGLGTHEQLMESCSIYREVYESQQKGGEDDA